MSAERDESKLLSHRLAFWSGVGCIFVATVGLAGWIPGLGLLGSIREDYIPLAPSTGVAFLLLSFLLLGQVRGVWRRWPRMIPVTIAALTGLFGLLELLGHFAGVDLSFEDALVPSAGKLGEIPTARMSPFTGAAFFVAGLATALLIRSTGKAGRGLARDWAGGLGLVTFAAGLIVILGYGYGSPLMYGGTTIPMAAPTAISFLLLGVSLTTSAGPSSLPLRLAAGASTRARLIRAFLPLTIAALLIQGALSHFIPVLTNVNAALLSAAAAVALTALTSVVASRVAHNLGDALDTAEAERRRAEEDRQSLEAQIQHAQKLESLGLLAGGIAHDFNNLLAAILGNADLALRATPPHSPALKYAEEIRRTAVRAADLTNQLLAYSGRGRFVVEPLDLNQLLADIAELLRVSISKKVNLEFELAEDLPTIDGDAAQIGQIVMNLITNASEAIGDSGGEITLSTGSIEVGEKGLDDCHPDRELPAGHYAFLQVSDTGCGMDEETIKRLFEPFFSTKFTGRGLGMAAALGIVRGHHGAIRIESAVGRGSAIQVLLPPSTRPARRTRDPVAEEGDAWRGSGTWLVVDDEDSVREVAKSMLQELGIEVLTAGDGREGVDLFRDRADEIDGVLLDLTMPRMDGVEALRELRRIRPAVRVILSSGYDKKDVTSQFAEDRPSGFIQKPFDLETLSRKVKDALGPAAPPATSG